VPVMKMKKIGLFVILLAVLLCCNCKEKNPADADRGKVTAGTAAQNIEKKTVLQINERKFSNYDFKQFLLLQYPDISAATENASTPSNALISRLFDAFVEHKIVLYIANQHDIPIDKAELDDYLGKLGAPMDKIDKTAVIDAIKVQKFLYSQVYEPVNVSDQEIRAYYNAHVDDFRKKAEVLLYQILVKKKETAVRIRGILDNDPQQFEEIARKESISMEASKGGEMGYFEEGTLPKDMEQVVFSLRAKTISPVVESSYGFHIFKIASKKPGRLLYLDKVEPEIRQKLLSEKLRDAYQDFLVTAKQNLSVTIKNDALYFQYQTIKGDKGDENKKTINSDHLSDTTG
jgi:hypothetical protein